MMVGSYPATTLWRICNQPTAQWARVGPASTTPAPTAGNYATNPGATAVCGHHPRTPALGEIIWAAHTIAEGSDMTARYDDPLHNAALFDVAPTPAVSLADKFVIPPMSVLDRRSGDWRERRAKWLSLGIKSELGRTAGAYTTLTHPDRNDFFSRILRGEFEPGMKQGMVQQAGGISVFDPVVCELVYRWFSPAGGTILDPFAGGSVRGIVASHLGRHYMGIDLSALQLAANCGQMDIAAPNYPPIWLHGNSANMDEFLATGEEFDLIFTCPPYGDLEVYSNHPDDISGMKNDEFLSAYFTIIDRACARLKNNRFAAIVVADYRDNKGIYRGFVANTIAAFAEAGLPLYNDAVILDPVGSAAMRAERQFVATRKLAKTHQNLLVFVKGDPRTATWECGGGLGRDIAAAIDHQEQEAT